MDFAYNLPVPEPQLNGSGVANGILFYWFESLYLIIFIGQAVRGSTGIVAQSSFSGGQGLGAGPNSINRGAQSSQPCYKYNRRGRRVVVPCSNNYYG